MVGRTVLHYQFQEKLGAGGMGDIYKAQDTRLYRFVAVKVLSGAHAGDPERRRRFIQEAQAASGLNHPNIITIHDIVSEGDTEFMIMEYVGGKTLVDLIPKGGLRVPLALKYATQMADALTAAHAAGIVHRDLKPGNVMVNDNGLVKVLDFGLAKLTDRNPASQWSDKTQTIAEAPLTVEGSIIGTVSYMSPEQAQGKKVDTRSDIFSFGVVFYEMLTGARAFSGDSALSTLSAILRDEHRPMAELAPEVPSKLELLIHRCLRKDPDERWQSMRDVLNALLALKHESDSGQLYRTRVSEIIPAVAPPAASAIVMPPPSAATPSKSKTGLIAGLVGAAILVLGGGGAGAWWFKHRPKPEPAVPVTQTQPVPVPVQPVTPVPEIKPAETVMTNDTVVEMVKGKVPNSVILSQIRESKTNFSLTSQDVIKLTREGVPAIVIEQMRTPSKPLPPEMAQKETRVEPRNNAVSDKKTTASSAPVIPVVTPKGAPTTSTTQTTQTSQAPPPPSSPKTTNPIVSALIPVSVPDGTPFSIILAENVPVDVDEGKGVRFTVSDGLKIGDSVIIAKGAVVTGAIVEVGGKKKILGMGGSKTSFKLMDVTSADGHKLQVRATPAKGSADSPSKRPIDSGAKGKTKEVAAASGSAYIAYIDGAQTVNIKK
jgi:serine/threonine protein kinase